MDFLSMTTNQLQELFRELSDELNRRTVRDNAAREIEQINARVLDAEGIKDGDPWRQPQGAHDAYPIGARAQHEGAEWVSLMSANVFEPGINSAWRKIAVGSEVLEWVQPMGTIGKYGMGDRVKHNGKTWESMIIDNVWEPGAMGTSALWIADEDPVVTTPPASGTSYPEWKQPVGTVGMYQIGDKVTYSGKNYVCTVANNVWAPGVYGWTLL